MTTDIHTEHAALNFLRHDSPQKMEPFAREMTQPLWHELVHDEPGYAALIAAARALRDVLAAPRIARPARSAHDLAADVLLDGGSLDDALQVFAEAQTIPPRAQAEMEILKVAATALEDRAQRFEAPRLRERLSQVLTDTVQQARAILDGELRGMLKPDDLAAIVANNPNGVDAWVQLEKIGTRFEQAFRLGELRAAPHTIAGAYPEEWLFVSYELAWPEYYSPGVESIVPVSAAFDRPLGAAPWHGLPPREVLLWIARSGLEVHAGGGQRHHEELVAQARKLLEQRMHDDEEKAKGRVGRGAQIATFTNGSSR